MKINLLKKRTTKSSKKRIQRFLLLPLYHSGSIFWLEEVIIKKNFNGRSYQTTDVKRVRVSK